MSDPTSTYFAALPQDEIGPELWKRVERYKDFLADSPVLRRIEKVYRAYYGLSDDGVSSSEISRHGTQGELARTKINQLRNLLQHIIVLVTANKPAAQAVSTNSDAKSQSQALLCNGILDYYMREKRIERHLRNAVEHAVVCGEGFIHEVWNANLGRAVMVDPMTGRPEREGEVQVRTPLWQNVIRDHTKDSWDELSDITVRSKVNKFELAAQFPAAAEAILMMDLEADYNERDTHRDNDGDGVEQDDIALYQYYHLDTDACPGGREVWFLSGGDTVLLDTFQGAGLVYKKLPVHRLATADIIGTSFGYTPAFDLLGPQEVHDKLTGILLSNNLSTGAQRVLIPRTANISLTALSEDLAALEYDSIDGAKPEALQLTKSAPETYKMVEMTVKDMETMAGISSATRGDPAASLKSGSALALVTSQSIQFASGLQASYAALLEDVLTALIDMLKMFATEERKISVGGNAKRWMAKSFSSADLAPIDRVTVEAVNPLRSTTAGRMEMAQMLQQSGVPLPPREMVNLVETGSLDGLLEPLQTETLNIRRENEDLSDGIPTLAVLTDNHAEHIKAHKDVVGSPDVRGNPAIAQAFADHVQQHINLWLTTDPAVLLLMGQQPPPMFQMVPPAMPLGDGGQPQPGVPGTPAPMGPPAPPEAAGPPPAGPAASNPLQGAPPPTPRMPRMPTNPLSGKQFDPTTGGLPTPK